MTEQFYAGLLIVIGVIVFAFIVGFTIGLLSG